MLQISEKTQAIGFFIFLAFAVTAQFATGGKLSLFWFLVSLTFCTTVALAKTALDRYQSRK